MTKTRSSKFEESIKKIFTPVCESVFDDIKCTVESASSGNVQQLLLKRENASRYDIRNDLLKSISDDLQNATKDFICLMRESEELRTAVRQTIEAAKLTDFTYRIEMDEPPTTPQACIESKEYMKHFEFVLYPAGIANQASTSHEKRLALFIRGCHRIIGVDSEAQKSSIYNKLSTVDKERLWNFVSLVKLYFELKGPEAEYCKNVAPYLVYHFAQACNRLKIEALRHSVENKYKRLEHFSKMNQVRSAKTDRLRQKCQAEYRELLADGKKPVAAQLELATKHNVSTRTIRSLVSLQNK